MRGLLFTTDGELREEPTRGAPVRVLARIVETPSGGLPSRLLCAEAEHEIVVLAQGGWAFELRDREGRRSGGFRPFRLRRGGRLRLGEITVALHGRPWSHEGWAFSTPDGRRVAATVVARGHEASPRLDLGVAPGRSAAIAVALDPAVPAENLPVPVGVLALGCWLILRWHRAVPADHVLVATEDADTRPGPVTAKSH